MNQSFELVDDGNERKQEGAGGGAGEVVRGMALGGIDRGESVLGTIVRTDIDYYIVQLDKPYSFVFADDGKTYHAKGFKVKQNRLARFYERGGRRVRVERSLLDMHLNYVLGKKKGKTERIVEREKTADEVQKGILDELAAGDSGQ
jgi:hypothetical protein